MSVDKSLIKKIQNLLNMTTDNGCTEEEASTAAKIAQTLLLKHGLSMDSVKGQAEEDSPEGICELKVDATKHGQSQLAWQVTLAGMVAKCTCCALLISKHTYGSKAATYWFIGTETNTFVAQEMFNWLSDQMVRLGMEARKAAYDQRGKDGHSQYIGRNFFISFMVGITTRVCERLRADFASLIKELDAGEYVFAKTDAAKAHADRISSGKSLDCSGSTQLNRRGLKAGIEAGDKVHMSKSNSIVAGRPALGGKS